MHKMVRKSNKKEGLKPYIPFTRVRTLRLVLHTGQGTRKNGEKKASEKPGLMRTFAETTSALKMLPQPPTLPLGKITASFRSKGNAYTPSHINAFVQFNASEGGGEAPAGKQGARKGIFCFTKV